MSIDFSWHKGGFDNVMLADFTLRNQSAYDVKDIVVTCYHYSPSKTLIDSNTRTIYELFPSGKTRYIKGFNMGWIHSQAASSSCTIEDLVISSGRTGAAKTDIRCVQRALQRKGFDPGPVDGIMGTKTRQAIKRFQENEGIDTSGEASTLLLTRLNCM